MSELNEVFESYFEIIAEDEEWVRDEALRLRYQVYCLEQGFEDATRFADRREVDQYDVRSVHAIVRHRKSGLTAATLRLILSDPLDPGRPFPIEEHCQGYSELVSTLVAGVRRQEIAEISRFAISKEFKRRIGEAGTVAGVSHNHQHCLERDINGKRVLPHLILGLFAAVFRMSVQIGIRHWYAVMDVSLLRLLSRFGIYFKPLGGPVDYHGLRQPCIGNVAEAVDSLWEKNQQAWKLVTADGVFWPEPMCGKQKKIIG